MVTISWGRLEIVIFASYPSGLLWIFFFFICFFLFLLQFVFIDFEFLDSGMKGVVGIMVFILTFEPYVLCSL